MHRSTCTRKSPCIPPPGDPCIFSFIPWLGIQPRIHHSVKVTKHIPVYVQSNADGIYTRRDLHQVGEALLEVLDLGP